MRNETEYRIAILGRLIRFVEREARFIGVDIEPEVTKMMDKLDDKNRQV